MTLKLRLALTLIASLIVSGCQNSLEAPKNTNQGFVTEYNGDLKALYKDAETNPTSILTTNNFNEYSENYSLLTMEFYQSESYSYRSNSRGYYSKRSNLEQNKPTDSKLFKKFFSGQKMITITPTSEVNYADYVLTIETNQLGARDLQIFLKSNDNGELDIVSLDYFTDVKTIHWSESKDKTWFSILISTGHDAEGNPSEVLAAYFHKIPDVLPDMVFNKKHPYSFVYGKELNTRWKLGSDVTLSLCGEGSVELKLIYVDAINQWAEVVKPYFNLKSEIKESAPPFSDLNTNCIYTSKHLRLTNSQSGSHTGSGDTLMFPNLDNLNFVSGRIFMHDPQNSFRSFYENGSGIDYVNYVHEVLLHEIGHFLGLGHKFNSDIASIMDYNDNKDITVFDVESIRFLYDDVVNKSIRKE